MNGLISRMMYDGMSIGEGAIYQVDTRGEIRVKRRESPGEGESWTGMNPRTRNQRPRGTTSNREGFIDLEEIRHVSLFGTTGRGGNRCRGERNSGVGDECTKVRGVGGELRHEMVRRRGRRVLPRYTWQGLKKSY